jgi:hypothetical protein
LASRGFSWAKAASGELVGRHVGRQLEVAGDEVVGDREGLAVDLLRRVGDGDVVVERLRHLLHAVGALEDGHAEGDLRLEAGGLLEAAPDEQVEKLVRAAELDVRLDHHRVVALRQRVEELVDRDRLAALVSLLEVVPLEHARDGVAAGELDHVGERHRGQPVEL